MLLSSSASAPVGEVEVCGILGIVVAGFTTCSTCQCKVRMTTRTLEVPWKTVDVRDQSPNTNMIIVMLRVRVRVHVDSSP